MTVAAYTEGSSFVRTDMADHPKKARTYDRFHHCCRLSFLPSAFLAKRGTRRLACLGPVCPNREHRALWRCGKPVRFFANRNQGQAQGRCRKDNPIESRPRRVTHLIPTQRRTFNTIFLCFNDRRHFLWRYSPILPRSLFVRRSVSFSQIHTFNKEHYAIPITQ